VEENGRGTSGYDDSFGYDSVMISNYSEITMKVVIRIFLTINLHLLKNDFIVFLVFDCLLLLRVI
jgi:hypothetical protein